VSAHLQPTSSLRKATWFLLGLGDCPHRWAFRIAKTPPIAAWVGFLPTCLSSYGPFHSDTPSVKQSRSSFQAGWNEAFTIPSLHSWPPLHVLASNVHILWHVSQSVKATIYQPDLQTKMPGLLTGQKFWTQTLG